MNAIKDALSKIADAGAPAPIGLDQVRGRARQIRRRRAATAILGSAAAVAAIAGLGVAVMPSGSNDDSRPPIAKTPTAPVSPTQPTQPAGADEVGPVHHVRLDVAAEQTFGDEAHVPYWSDGAIIDVDGTATPLRDRPFTFAKDPEKGGWAVVRPGEAHAELLRVKADGAVTDGPVPTFPEGLAVGPQGQVATLSDAGAGWSMTSGGRSVSLGRSLEWAAIDGFDPNGDVVVTVDGAVKVVDVFSGAVTDLHGATAAVPSAVLPLTAIGKDDGTWQLEDRSGDVRWSLDWAGVSSFSPNGRYVALTGDRDHRIPGSVDWDSEHATGTIWIRTSTDLLPVAAFTAPDNGYFGGWTWDGDTLLATVYSRDSGQWSLVRLSADGFTVGRATGKPGGGEEPAYVFAAQ
ncbi:hypothetical protein JCM18899A_04750 [Nocardioides sp. AN3]